MARGLKKGQTNNPNGRPPGIPNKTTALIKQAFIEAFEKLGGVPALVAWAQSEPGEFYKIVSRLCPKEMEVSGPDGGPIKAKIEVEFVNPNSKSTVS